MLFDINACLGDSRSFTIPLTKDGEAYSPDSETGALIFTAKYARTDADENSVFQKSSGAGITLSGTNAVVTIVREDTVDATPANLSWDIMWQDSETLERQPLNSGCLRLTRPVTREQQTSVPVTTTDDPLPFGVGTPPAMQRQFRVLGNEEAVLYTDGGIRYSGPDSYVSLPAPDETKIGTLIEFYGYDYGFPNGFYSNDGDNILPPSGAARGWFSVPSRARVTAQLNDEGNWQVTVLDPGIVNLPYASGEFGLNLTDGSRFYFAYLTGDTLFGINGGVNGDQIEVMIGWTQSTPTLSFDGTIKIPDAAAALMPFDLEVWRSYSFKCLVRGAYWTLQFPIQGPTIEGED